MKSSMSMLCSLVHGGSKQQPGVRAAQEDSLPASVRPETPAAAEPAPSPVPAPERVPSPVKQEASGGARFGQAYIKVVGCGGGGGNAISRMMSAGLQVMN